MSDAILPVAPVPQVHIQDVSNMALICPTITCELRDKIPTRMLMDDHMSNTVQMCIPRPSTRLVKGVTADVAGEGVGTATDGGAGMAEEAEVVGGGAAENSRRR